MNREMGTSEANTKVTILHFNDVYNIESRDKEPVGGAARFCTAVKAKADLNPLVLFSGDAFNPSMMSSITKGKQMVPCLNAIGVHCAVYGNHDFDFGVDTLVKMAHQCNFPWLLSNVMDETTGEILAEGKSSQILTWQGKKIGLMGLVEEEWIDTLSTLDPDDIIFLDYVEEGRRIAKQLKEQGADYIIALTHMRWPNDTILAESVDEIDLILGGHDHDYTVKQINGKYVIKSGTDFRNMSQVTLTFGETVKVSVEEVQVTSAYEEDAGIKVVVAEYSKVMGARMEVVLGQMEVELEGRFANIRNQETNLGNFVTDVMLEATDAEVALLNSGTLRSDTIHPKGDFKVKDLKAILPMVDPVVVIKITGVQLVEALENGVSQYPALEGRFPQVAGVNFGFDPSQPPGKRIDGTLVKVQGHYLKPNKTYTLCTKHYLANGKDGYDVFKQCPVIVGEEEGPRLSIILQNHFNSVKIARGQKTPKFLHHQSLVPLSRRRNLVRQMSMQESEMRVLLTPQSQQTRSSPAVKRAMFRRRHSIQSAEEDYAPSALAPKVEGRILLLDEYKVTLMREERLLHDLHNTPIEADENEG